MSQRYSIDGQILTDMADAIRNSTGIKPSTVVAPGYLNPGEKSSGQIMPDLKAGQRYKITITCSYTTDGNYKRALLTIKENDSSGAVLFNDYVYQRAVEAYITPSVDTTYFMFGLGSNNYCTIDSIALEPCDADGNVLCYYTPEQMVGVMETNLIPEEAWAITDAKDYMFAYNAWNWFLEAGDGKLSIRTGTGKQLFYASNKLTNIPCDIHIDCISSSSLEVLDGCFTNCSALSKLPNIYLHNPRDIYGETTKVKLMKIGATQLNHDLKNQCIFFDDSVSVMGFGYQFFDGYKGGYPAWLFDGTVNIDWDTMRATNNAFGSLFPVSLINASNIRTFPAYKEFYTTHNSTTEYYHFWYSFTLSGCYTLEEITFPRPGSLTLTNNKFSGKLNNTCRLKSFTFDTQADGTPYTANWKSQTIDISNNVGYVSSTSYLDGTGLTTDTKIDSEEKWRGYIDGSYPDGWAATKAYSVYGASAARETINSLPDTSAFGTNTIKFPKDAASAIPGEHIETNLTEEDIAVAAAKGWTVTLS